MTEVGRDHFAAVVSGLERRRGGHFYPWVVLTPLLSSVRPEGSFPRVSVVVEALGPRPMTPRGRATRWFGRSGRFWLVGGVVSGVQPTFPRSALEAWFRGVSPRFESNLGLANLHLVPT